MGLLNILNEDGQVVGQAERSDIHAKGLLHAEVHVIFYTPDGKIIWQHRAKIKDTYPDLLDVAVGGHVEIGDTYESTVVKEMREEAGLDVDLPDLTFLEILRARNDDHLTHTTNNIIDKMWAYRFGGNLDELKIEEGECLGFEAWPIEKLLNLSEEEKKKFVPFRIGKESLAQFRTIQGFLK